MGTERLRRPTRFGFIGDRRSALEELRDLLRRASGTSGSTGRSRRPSRAAEHELGEVLRVASSYGVGLGRAVARSLWTRDGSARMVSQRHVDERAPVRHQLHRRGQSALDDCEVAAGERPEGRGRSRRRACPRRLDRVRSIRGPHTRSSRLRARRVGAPRRPLGFAAAGAFRLPSPPRSRRPACRPGRIRAPAAAAPCRRNRPVRTGARSRVVEMAAVPAGMNGSPGPKSARQTTSSREPTKSARSRTYG